MLHLFVGLRLSWKILLAILIVPFMLLGFFAPSASSASDVPAWHPHYYQRSSASSSQPSVASTRRAAGKKETDEGADPDRSSAADVDDERQGRGDEMKSEDPMVKMCREHDRLPEWLLKQCDPKVLAMVRDFIAHEHMLGTELEGTVLEQKMKALQNTEWRDGTPVGLWSDNPSEFKHFNTADPAEMMKIMQGYLEDAPTHLRLYLKVRARDGV